MTVPGTIKSRAIAVCITTVIAFAINALMTQFLQVRLLTNLEQTRNSANALRNHGLPNMIQANLRGIVHESLTSQERRASQQDLESDLHSNTATIHEFRASNKKLALTGDVQKALDGVEDPLNDYIDFAAKIVGMAFSNRPAAMLELGAFDSKLKVLKSALKNVGDLIEITTNYLTTESTRPERQSRVLGLTTLGLSAFMMLGFSCLVRHNLLRPQARIQSAMKHLASESTAVLLVDLDGQDEIDEMSRTISVFHATSLDRTKLISGANLLSQLNCWLQSCKSLDEVYDMTAEFLSELLPGGSGSLYIYADSRDVLEGTKAWSGGTCVGSMAPDECWGLRQARVYTFGQQEIEFPSSHVEQFAPSRYCCIPILAYGETIGLLHLDFCDDGHVHNHGGIDEEQRLSLLCAKQIGLAIANAKLRDQLRINLSSMR